MKENKKIRLFVAVSLPSAVQQAIVRVQNRIKKAALCDGRYVNAAQAHLTLVFIGEVDVLQVDAIDAALQLVSFPVIEAQVGKLGYFQKHGSVAVICLDIVAPLLGTLAHAVFDVLKSWSAKEDREFVSHATIMRVKKVFDKEKLVSLLDNTTVEPLVFPVESFVLMQSELGSDGPKYTERARYLLVR